MPELPEVEVTRRSLEGMLTGQCIQSVRLGKPLRWPLGCEPGSLAQRMVQAVRRRGKYLLLELDAGLLLMHLGMSGSLRFAADLPSPGPHDHFDMVFAHGVLRLHDPRRFGAVVFASGLDSAQATRLLGGLGLEPLSEDYQWPAFWAALHGSRQAMKPWLLSGRFVVGVGNIYASEVLFMAGIHPRTPACRVSQARARRLFQAIREVLTRAVALGGTTLRDFSGADGMAGHFQNETRVYGREGQACCICDTPVRQIRQGQRSTFYCPTCQRR